MTTDRVRDIFLAAMDLAGAARDRFLAEACGGDEALRARVDRLLAIDAAEDTMRAESVSSQDSTKSVGDGSGGDAPIPAPGDGLPMGFRTGDSVDGFKILEVIGEGGMGVVYLAEQQVPVKRRIALKVIKPGMDSKAVLARFEAERQALALMDHPGIARVLQAGTTEVGLPYFVMEYVKGDSITTAADRLRLDTRQRIELMIMVCEAVQHAHMKGVIHRDLKPSNILVTTGANDEMAVKIIDFGVAKAMSQPLTDMTLHTQVGHFIGTPAYMSPEQAELTSSDIDTRTDVYSLGVVLYELLTGQLPFDPSDLRAAGLEEMRRRIREDDPPKPSTRLTRLDDETATRISKARKTRLDQLQRSLAIELDWIPLRALRKQLGDRYASPTDLGRDLRRYLEGEPLEAGPESAGYRLRKFVAKRRTPIAVGGAVAVILSLATAVSGWLAVEASRARDDESMARVTAEFERKSADTARALAEAKADEALVEKARAEDFLAVFSVGKALNAARAGDSLAARNQLAIVEAMGRGDRFDVRLARAMSDQSIASLDGGQETVSSVAFSPNGLTLASGSGDKTIRLWDVATEQPIGEPLRGHELRVLSIAFSPDGLMLASGGLDKTIRLWDVSTGKPIGEPLRGHELRVASVAFSPDGSMLASGSYDKTVRLWDVSTGLPIGEPLRGHEGGVERVTFSPDGLVLASGGLDKTIRLWDVLAEQPIGEPLRGHWDRVGSVAFSPDGSVLAIGGKNAAIYLWDVATKQPIGEPLRGHVGHIDYYAIFDLAFSPDGSMLASGGHDRTIRLWDVSTGKPIGEPLRGHELRVASVAFSPDGSMLASGSYDKTVRLWDVSTDRSIGEPLRGHGVPHASISFSPDGLMLANWGGDDGTIRIWDVATGQSIGEPLRGHPGDGKNRYSRDCSLAFSPDGSMLASGSWDSTIRLWDVATRQPIGEPLRGHEGGVGSVAFSPGGSVLASGGLDKTIRLWDVSTGKPIGEPLYGHELDIFDLAFSPDGSMLASGGQDSTIRLWDVSAWQPIGEPLRGHDAGVLGLAFSPDGLILASGSWDSTIRLWDVVTGQPIGEPLRGHAGKPVLYVAISPDGSVLASGGYDKTIRLWDVVTGQPIGEPLRGHRLAVDYLAFSPDGSVLASGSDDTTIRLWHAVPLRDRIGLIRRRRAELDLMRPVAPTTDSPANAGGS